MDMLYPEIFKDALTTLNLTKIEPKGPSIIWKSYFNVKSFINVSYWGPFSQFSHKNPYQVVAGGFEIRYTATKVLKCTRAVKLDSIVLVMESK